MTSGTANHGNYIFATPNYATTPVCNFPVNQQFGVPAANFQGYPVNVPVANVYPMFQNVQIPGHLVQGTPIQVQQLASMPPPRIPIYHMDVEELATWVKDFANFKQWSEADKYAKSFLKKGIDGKKLIRMTNNQLWMQLQIAKLGHRLEILRAVKELRSMQNRCADAMERYHRYCYSDSEKSVASLDPLPWSDQEPQGRSGRKCRGNIRMHGRESEKTVWSDVDRNDYYKPSSSSRFGGTETPNETLRGLKLVSSGGGKTLSNRASDVLEGEAASNEIMKHEKTMLQGPGSDRVQQEKIKNISKVDNPVQKNIPFIDFEKDPWDHRNPMLMNRGRKSTTVTPIAIMNRGRKSTTVTPIAIEKPSPHPKSTPTEEKTDGGDNAGYNFEENKREAKDKFRLPSSW